MTKSQEFLRRSRFAAGAAPLALGLALISSAAYAQDALPASAAAPAPDADVIVVTGSRIPQPNLTSVSPVTVLNSQDIKNQGITRVEDLINSLPQSFASQGSTISNGSSGTATLNLRGLGESRTLVLVNGRRLLPGDPTSPFADINTIPSALIKRIDVLTGGASTVYGADAVSGVVNFVMDTDFEGVRLDGLYSFYQHDNDIGSNVTDALNARNFGYPSSSNKIDGQNVDATLTIGAGFDDNRGHVVAYVGYRKTRAILQANRDFSSCNLAGGPTDFVCGGSNAAPTTGRFITDNGTFTVSGNNFIPYDGNRDAYNFGPTNYFQRPDERYTFGAFANYEINESFKPYLEAMFMDDRTVAQIAPSGAFGVAVTLDCANPLLSAQQASLLCPDGGEGGSTADVIVGRRNVEGGGRRDDLQHTSYRAVVGMKGDINKAFSYDTYFQYGRVVFAETYFNDFSNTRLARSLDIVTNDAGDAVCRSFANGTDPNCVPYNIFSAGGVTPGALAYLQTPGFQRGNTQEKVFNASITGVLGEYGIKSPWADTGLGINIGYEYRKESLELNTDQAFSTGDLAGQGGATIGLAGGFDVNEFFSEARFPIIEGKPFFESLTIEGGYRYSKYKNTAGASFSAESYKGAIDWAPTSDIRLRASYNRAVRAPNAVELFRAQSVALDGGQDPCAGATPTATLEQCARTGVTAAQYGNIIQADQTNGLLGGNPNLQPEKADTKSLGLVFTPSFLPGFAASVDYFDIKVKNRIGRIGADTIMDACYNNNLFCDQIVRDRLGSINVLPTGYVIDTNLNAGELGTKGIDVNMSYNRQIGDIGTLGFSIAGTWLDQLTTTNVGIPKFDCAGFFGANCGTPNSEWRHKARVTFTSASGIGASLQWRYFSAVKIESQSSNPVLSDPTADPYKVGAQSYFDLALTGSFADHVIMRLGVNNVFDKTPPLIGAQVTADASLNGNTFPQVYDALGRYVYIGATLTF